MESKRVVVVQEVLASYRVEFYERLRRQLAEHDVRLELVYGTKRTPRSFGDEAAIGWATPTRVRVVSVRNVRAVWVNAWVSSLRADLVIVEHANAQLFTWLIALKGRWSSGPLVAFWGHGSNLQAVDSGFRAQLKRQSTNLASWWFAYTSGSRDRVVGNGFPSSRVTVVNNSVDASKRLDSAPPDTEQLVFIGSLHRLKRLDYLVDALSAVLDLRPGVTIKIAGDGPGSAQVKEFAHRFDQVEYVGRVDGAAKQNLLKSSSLILNPGLIGLVAVDSLASAAPLVTLDDPNHSPEFEYLNPDCALILPRETSATAFARAVVDLLDDKMRLVSLREDCLKRYSQFSLDYMVSNFTRGILAALNDDSLPER